MTRDDAKILWPIIKAWSEGKTVQMRYTEGWTDMDLEYPGFTCGADKYRIKPEPLECWGVVNARGKLLHIISDGRPDAAFLKDVGVDCRAVHLREVQED